jgi:hypothetical protein
VGDNPVIPAIYFIYDVPHTKHNKFCDARQVADIGAASLAKPCRPDACAGCGVTIT